MSVVMCSTCISVTANAEVVQVKEMDLSHCDGVVCVSGDGVLWEVVQVLLEDLILLGFLGSPC